MSLGGDGTVSFSEMTPYAAAAGDYISKGWIPLPVRGKGRGRGGGPPTGFTGKNGQEPNAEAYQYWAESKGDWNVALRLPRGVVGIDVDAYGEKAGAETLAALVAARGELPLTWVTTSRVDGVSGIRMLRVPEGWEAPSALGPGIEVVVSTYRYAVAWPSRHPDTGLQYKWHRELEGGGREECGIPRVSELPELPEGWLSGWPRFASGTYDTTARSRDDGDRVDIDAMIRDGAGPDGGQRRALLALTMKLAGMGRSETEAKVIWDAVIAATPQDPSQPWTDDYFEQFFHDAQVKVTANGGGAHLEVSESLFRWARGTGVTASQQNGSEAPASDDGILEGTVIGGDCRLPLMSLSEDDLAVLLAQRMVEWRGGGGDDEPADVNLGETREKLPRSDVEAASFLAMVTDGELCWSPIASHWRWWDGVIFHYDGDSRVDALSRGFAAAYKQVMRDIQRSQVAFWMRVTDRQPNESNEAFERRAVEAYQAIWGKHRAYRDRLFSQAGQAGLLNALKACVSRDERQFDAAPGVLPCDNGIITFAADGTAQLAEHAPSWLVTKRLAEGARLEPGTPAPVFEQFLKTSVPDAEQREFLQSVIGASLTGFPWKGLLVFLGEGDSGKSTFASFLMRMLGGFATAIDVDALSGAAPGNNEFRLANLRGRTLAVASEPAKGNRVNSTVIKSITGGDEQTTRTPYAKASVTWKPRCLLIVVTNHGVGFETSDEAMMRRLGIITFKSPPQLDHALPEKLDAEMPGALAWALEGAERWLRAGKHLTVPTSVLMARESMADDADTCLSFVSEMIADGILAVDTAAAHNACVRTSDLFQHYRFWCQRENCRQAGSKTFSQRVGRRFPVVRSDGSRFSSLTQVGAFLALPS